MRTIPRALFAARRDSGAARLRHLRDVLCCADAPSPSGRKMAAGSVQASDAATNVRNPVSGRAQSADLRREVTAPHGLPHHQRRRSPAAFLSLSRYDSHAAPARDAPPVRRRVSGRSPGLPKAIAKTLAPEQCPGNQKSNRSVHHTRALLRVWKHASIVAAEDGPATRRHASSAAVPTISGSSIVGGTGAPGAQSCIAGRPGGRSWARKLSGISQAAGVSPARRLGRMDTPRPGSHSGVGRQRRRPRPAVLESPGAPARRPCDCGSARPRRSST